MSEIASTCTSTTDVSVLTHEVLRDALALIRPIHRSLDYVGIFRRYEVLNRELSSAEQEYIRANSYSIAPIPFHHFSSINRMVPSESPDLDLYWD